jgi:AraC-like DNA-binding protein
MPVQRIEMTTQDMDVIAGLMNERYVEHRARFWCDDPARVDAGVRTATAGPLEAALVRLRGFHYQAEVSPPDALLALGLLTGTGTMAFGQDQVSLTRGDVMLDATDLHHTADMYDSVLTLVRLPRPVAAEVAEEHTGLPATDLRFESVTPVSAAAGEQWARTASFICRQLITSGITEISPLMAHNMTRLVAATLLEAFPNTTMTAPYIPSSGQVAPSAVRRAAAFMDAHAGSPVTVAEVAGAAGVSVRTLQYAFRSYYGITPTGYLRRVRLEQAHRQLQTADPAVGMTVAKTARRWGWANQAKFAAAYRAQYGVPPSHTLRS